MHRVPTLLPLFVALFLSVRTFAQNAVTEPRIALLMGVGDYAGTKFQSLPGIDQDIKRMKTALTAAGFQITVVENPTLSAAEEAIETFGARLKSQVGGVGLFYFSGHGGEFEGKNYMIPKGARIGSNRDIKEQAVAAQRVLNRMDDAGARVNLVFLDCCRNDLTKAATDTGLAAMQARGTFIGFATGTDKTSAASREGSPYTTFLAQRLLTPGVSVLDMHTQVTADVEDFARTNSLPEQTPFQYSGLRSNFYFVPGQPSADLEQEIQRRVKVEMAKMTGSGTETPRSPSAPLRSADPTEVAVVKTSKGEMVIEFWPDVAPHHVENFKKLAKQGFYDGTAFHRVIKGFMIQGGDPLTKDDKQQARWGTGDPGYKIKAEFNNKSHTRGVVSMARSQDPNSAGSQFFICHGNPSFLDGQYTVFGKLIKGDDVLEKIATTATTGTGTPQDRPIERVNVESVRIVPRGDIR